LRFSYDCAYRNQNLNRLCEWFCIIVVYIYYPSVTQASTMYFRLVQILYIGLMSINRGFIFRKEGLVFAKP